MLFYFIIEHINIFRKPRKSPPPKFHLYLMRIKIRHLWVDGGLSFARFPRHYWLFGFKVIGDRRAMLELIEKVEGLH